MENLAISEPSLERDMGFMLLLKQAYDQDRKLIILCVYDPMRPGMARQGYMEVMGKRMLVIVLKDLLLPIMPGEKPKSEFYRE